MTVDHLHMTMFLLLMVLKGRSKPKFCFDTIQFILQRVYMMALALFLSVSPSLGSLGPGAQVLGKQDLGTRLFLHKKYCLVYAETIVEAGNLHFSG